VEQEVGGSSPPNCTSRNNHLVDESDLQGLRGVDAGVDIPIEGSDAFARSRRSAVDALPVCEGYLHAIS
jgi:hypothetical protein